MPLGLHSGLVRATGLAPEGRVREARSVLECSGSRGVGKVFALILVRLTELRIWLVGGRLPGCLRSLKIKVSYSPGVDVWCPVVSLHVCVVGYLPRLTGITAESVTSRAF